MLLPTRAGGSRRRRDDQLDTPRTIGALLDRAVQSWGPQVALRRRREALNWSVSTWSELGERSRAVGAGLLRLGVEAGDSVALWSNTRLEWTLADYGTLCMGAVTVPIYHSVTTSQALFILRDSGAKVLFLENRAQLEALRPHLSELPELRHLVLFEVTDLRDVAQGLLLDELLREGRRALREDPEVCVRAGGRVGSDWLATIVYTSGTTGRQKGVRLTHANLLAAIDALDRVLEVGPEDVTLLCLPLSHIYARLGQFAALHHGFCIAYAQRVDLLQEVLVEVRPTFFLAVPRIFERIFHRVVAGYRSMPPLLRASVKRGIAGAKEAEGFALGPGGIVSSLDSEDGAGEGRAAQLLARTKVASLGKRLSTGVHGRVAEKALFGPLREALGGRIRFCVSGGAALNPEVARFFRVAGIELLEGYGLTETGGAATLNPAGENRLGTVGRPLPGLRIRIAPDGEVLLKGPMVFDGYHRQPGETEAALDADGWLHTGDIGALDDAGYLLITDRKKDILVTSGGKNIAPQQVEAALRMSPYVGDAMVFGDGRPHPVALLALSEEDVRDFAVQVDLPTDDWGALLAEPRVRELLETEVKRCNERLANFCRVRHFRILPRGLSVEGGELTPTLKVRRRAVQQRYRPLIEGMYAEDAPA